MTRVADAVGQLEESLFVGRRRELDVFRGWLLSQSSQPEVLRISGPGGVGKTTLMHAFRRIALDLRWRVILVDGRDFQTRQGLLAVLCDGACTELDDAVAYLNDVRPLILIDTFEELSGLPGFIREDLVPRLDTAVRLAIAGRHAPDLQGPRTDQWLRIIHPLPLDGFTSAEIREYLARRGISDPRLTENVARAAGGNPLAVSLAADMALQFNTRDFTAAPQWHLVVRSLVERLLRDIREPELRELLEACAVIHQFDEASLAAISGRDQLLTAFDQLCRLSIVRPAEHGLQLHDDVRRQLAMDLSWRQPERYELLRERALTYYSGRLRTAPPRDHPWLVAECFFLWTNALIQHVFFAPAEPGDVHVESRRPGDDQAIRELHAARIETMYASELGDCSSLPLASDRDFLEAILAYPGSRVRVALNDHDQVLGFSTVIPICRASIPIMRIDPGTSALLDLCWTNRQLGAPPADAESARSFLLCQVVQGPTSAGAVRGALLRDFSGLFALGGTYFCSTVLPSYKSLLEACGFRRLPEAETPAWGDGHMMDGYVLDLSDLGFESWIEAMVTGRPVVGLANVAALEQQVQSVLQHWSDNTWLGRSPLLRLVQPTRHRKAGPAGLRDAVEEALAGAERHASREMTMAYRAVRLAYLTDDARHKQAFRELAVSRATFYRMVRRGVRGLAEALSR